jgi:hypothetical protein
VDVYHTWSIPGNYYVIAVAIDSCLKRSVAGSNMVIVAVTAPKMFTKVMTPIVEPEEIEEPVIEEVTNESLNVSV